MKKVTQTAIYLIVAFFMFAAQSAASSQNLPVIKGKEVVALVNNEPITLEEFSRSLASIEHETMDADTSAAKVDYAGILNRMIDEKLFLQEARNIGLHELPEVKRSIDDNSQRILAKLLVRKELKNIEADQEEVDRLYKEATKELKITGVVFEKENDAKAMAEQIEAGKSFDETVKKAVEDGTVKESLEGRYLKNRDLWPQVADVVSGMETGSISPVISLGQGFVIFRLDDVRFTDDPDVKEKIIHSSIKIQREKALYEYSDTLIDKYVKINDKVFDSVDYDISVEQFDKLLEDNRVIAKVRGGEPVTVRELSASFKNKFYHGVADHIKRNKLNDRKKELLEKILQKRVFLIEARKQGLDKTESYRTKIENFKKALILGSFMEKVVTPGIKLNEDELRDYYKKNASDYTYPEMMRIWSIAFRTMDDAKDAIAKLRKGTDFKWLSANAEGKVGEDEADLMFQGNIISARNLPADIHELLQGIDQEDYRLYTGTDGFHYVLYVPDVYPSKQKSFAEVKKELAEIIYNDKIKKEMKDWSDKLKDYYKVEIYLTKF